MLSRWMKIFKPKPVYKSNPISHEILHNKFPLFNSFSALSKTELYRQYDFTILGSSVTFYEKRITPYGFFDVATKVVCQDIDITFVATDEASSSLVKTPNSYYVTSTDEETLMNFIMKYFG